MAARWPGAAACERPHAAEWSSVGQAKCLASRDDAWLLRCSRMTRRSHEERGSALLAAIIGADLQAVQAELERDPSLVSYRVLRDTFVESIPHWLYVGDTLLHLAAASLQDDISETLLRRGAAVAAINRRGASPLHYACDPRPRRGVWDPSKQRRVIHLLVDAGADVNLPDSGGVTPFIEPFVPVARRPCASFSPAGRGSMPV